MIERGWGTSAFAMVDFLSTRADGFYDEASREAGPTETFKHPAAIGF